MFFTYRGYEEMLSLLRQSGYTFSSYVDYVNALRPVILRHDVDLSLEKAYAMAMLENKNNIKSTYFVLVATDFYNISSKRSKKLLKQILNLEHNIGLHFDETVYGVSTFDDLKTHLRIEISILTQILGSEINCVSMHRPSKKMLEADMRIDGVINSYSKVFFREFKYLSDSRMTYREDIRGTICDQKYNKLHILTHPFWYSDNQEPMKKKLLHFIRSAGKERYLSLRENFADLDSVLRLDEIG